MAYGLSDRTVGVLHSILEQHPEITRAILHGCPAVGREKPGSDIDLSLVGSALTHGVLTRVLAEGAESQSPARLIYSSTMTSKRSLFKDHIDRRGVVFYEACPLAGYRNLARHPR